MSDKLQFVVAFGRGRMAETSDKLKFVGHFQRHFALLPSLPAVSLDTALVVLSVTKTLIEAGSRRLFVPPVLKLRRTTKAVSSHSTPKASPLQGYLIIARVGQTGSLPYPFLRSLHIAMRRPEAMRTRHVVTNLFVT